MKTPLILLVLVLLFSANVSANDDTVTLPIADYKAILNRLDALQKRVEFLESSQDITVPVQTVPPAKPKTCEALARDIDIIYGTMDELETKKLQNKLNFGAELRTRVDTYKATNYDEINMTTFMAALDSGASYNEAAAASLEHIDKHKDYNNWYNQFRINMEAQVTDTIDFHGRFSYAGYWGDSDNGDAFFQKNQVFLGGHDGIGGIDRFYVNWIPKNLPIPFALTIGRQPSSEGPPFEIKENTVRQSTYPALLFNGVADGIVVTLGMDRYTTLNNSGFRFAYGKAYHSDDDSSLSPFPFFNDNEAGDSDIYAGFFESEIPGLDKSLMVFSYARMSGLPTAFFGPMEPLYSYPNENIGDMDLWGVHLQAKNLFDNSLALFFSYGGNHSIPDKPSEFGLLSWDNLDSHTGHAFYTGLRYTVPYELLNHPKLGFEYNHGSRYWYSMTIGCPSPFNKLATRGSVYDFYYIQPINKYLFFRAGYLRADFDYSGSGTYIGEPTAIDTVLEDIYLLMDIHF